MKKQLLRVGAIVMFASLVFTGCKKDEESKTEEVPTIPTQPVTPANPDDPSGKPADFMASDKPSNRMAILEDFTGVRCGFCPDGHVKAKAVADANPTKFIIMAVHAGSYAAPQTGWANFTTPFGEPIDDQALVSGYPAGTINRIKAADLGATAQKPGGTAMSRGAWGAAAAAVWAQPSPLNIAGKATFNKDTRELTVRVDIFYTKDDEKAKKNNINVALLQNKLMSKQSGASTNPYEQNHVLRHLLTGQWGDPILTIEKKSGDWYTKTYKYIVPADYNGTTTEGGGAVIIENCEVVVFVSQERVNILTGAKVPITQ